ncbi:MAG: hypothetical protein CME63_04345 [Halobacteriovoraceae bacterium]|nr:hypothetical protein [Halobacteriovoraceae bacterium]|tara:strand:+ start:250368 stop:251093 length:726 start_codon:yes stop_codon:yes gene_type:complete
MKKILFLGLGHLGTFFISQNKGHEIIGTNRSGESDFEIPIISYQLGARWDGPRKFDIIIISFPPTQEYAENLKILLSDLKPFQKIIFVSSTSVFGNGMVSELSPQTGQTRNAQELIECESLIKSFNNHVIIRPGGLIDEHRHPRRFFENRTHIKKSKTQVNLVHTYDVASFIHFAIDQGITNEDFNLICDDHPTKEEFYGSFHHHLDYDSQGSETRILSNRKSKEFGFEYKFSTLEWTQHS